MKALILDIDGTLADLTHRLHHIKNGNRNWDAFFDGVKDDMLIEPIRDLAITLQADYKIILVSGRPEKTRADTEDWMHRHGVPFSELHMRPDGDYRQDYIIKSQILDHLISAGNDISVVIDDRSSVVAMWRERGLICLQCREWEEDEKPAKRGLLTIMVGPSGAGKSTWLDSEPATAYGIDGCHVVGSDEIRADLCEDYRDQTQNDRVFAALHAVAKARIDVGLPAVIDATNIRRKDRMACAELAAGSPVRYIVIDRPLTNKLATKGQRPDGLIERHAQTFDSQIKDILAGDGLPNVEVVDLRGWR